MKKTIFVILILGVVLTAYTIFTGQKENPLLTEFNTPFQVPPFDKIEEAHFLPAFKAGITEQQNEIDSIVNNNSDPTFENTIEALEYSGALLDKVSGVFYNLLGANTNDELQQIAKDVSPLLSKSSDDILLNKKLFSKIKAVHQNKEAFNLNAEEEKLLDETYKSFVRNGANLNEEDKEKLRKINEELSMLSLQFGENLLDENNAFKLVIEEEENLSGLPESVIESAAEAAESEGLKGNWVFTLQKPSFIPFLQYSNERELREKIFKAYINRGDNNDENDNKEIIKKILALRIDKANLLGYETHADYVLEDRMAKNADNVYDLLNKVWAPALEVAKKEATDLQAMIDKDGKDFKLKPWDWWYYAEKVKKEKYDLDEKELRPYFKLENVRDGAFETATKLYGIQFEKRNDIPKYHPDVEVFELKEADGSHIGILYTDYFPRESKRGGAWMNSYRKQSIKNGEMVTPVIFNVGNFSKPTGDKPSLLSYDEALTLFHEFGHALHGLLSNVKYESLSGTAVSRDFVELPSQIMENWASHPKVMKSYAKHYETGEPIPDELIEKIQKSENFNQGFATVEFLAAAFLDMDWHTMNNVDNIKVNEFEQTSLDKIGLIPEIVVRYRTPNYNHIFSSGYSAGYYSYIWAEVLDADAFEAFKAKGIFDKETAEAFRKNILEKGGTEEPMELYIKFRGSEPKIDPLLERRGLKDS